eukprot:5365837-Alexandrium_andersonii.AAC.1
MGGKWIKWCDMAECWMVLFVKSVHVERFSKCWKMCESHTQQVRLQAWALNTPNMCCASCCLVLR